MMQTVKLIALALHSLACAYRVKIAGDTLNEIVKLDEKISDLAADGSPAAKLRLESLAIRREYYLEQFRALRSTNGLAD